VDNCETTLEVSGQSYGFETLFEAQARGDFEALLDKHRRILRLVVQGDVAITLNSLADALVS